MHTWSLSAEWQFYIILPLALLAIWKLRPGRIPLTIMVALGLLLSLLLSIVLSPIKSSAAFYLLPTRAWEMLAGGLVYLLANPLQLSATARKILEGSGFALIVASIALFDAGTVWPGWQALVPVIGTMLVLIAARQGSLWTGSRIGQWLGDCSYSLYLWHWPFTVMLVYLDMQGHAAAIAVGLALTLLCGWLSYRLIETPTRNGLARIPQWHGAGALAVAVVLVALPGLAVYLKQGLPARLPEHIVAVLNEAENKNPRMEECHVSGSTLVPECTYGGDKLGVIVIGDSHAASVIQSIGKSLPKNLHALDWTLSSCSTIAGLKDKKDKNYRCGSFVENTIATQQSLPRNVPIIIVNRLATVFYGPNEPDKEHQAKDPNRYIKSPHHVRSNELFQEMRTGIIDTACEFTKTRPVYMVRPIPELKLNVPNTMARALLIGEPRQISISLEEYHQRHAFTWETQDLAAERCGVKILDPLPYLCREGRCWGDVDGLPIYYDDDHLNERGASLLIPMFRQALTGAASATEQSAARPETDLQGISIQ